MTIVEYEIINTFYLVEKRSKEKKNQTILQGTISWSFSWSVLLASVSFVLNTFPDNTNTSSICSI